MHDILRKRLYEKAGLIEKEKLPSLESLRKSEWSDEFEELMRNRLVMGAYRYGLIKHDEISKHDRMDSILTRLGKFAQTGNTEYMVDAANLCMLEFINSNHPNKHFASIDDGEHVKEI